MSHSLKIQNRRAHETRRETRLRWVGATFVLMSWYFARSVGTSAAQSATTAPPAPPSSTASAGASAVPSASAIAADVPRDLLTFYKDNYVIAGFDDATEVKLQFSAKFDLWPNATQHAAHFGFTAKSLWNVYRASAPFAETNYNPEVFYTFFHHRGRDTPPPGCGFFHERFGIEHESNGEAAERSRSWDRICVQSRFACYGSSGLFATASLKVWAPPLRISDNPDIVAHLGYGELGMSFGSEGLHNGIGDLEISFLARKGTNSAFAEGSIELDARWRPRYAEWWRLTPYLYVQLFSGFGETLLSYDRALTAFRVGIALSDTSARTN
jgi:phospholipase A1/A2